MRKVYCVIAVIFLVQCVPLTAENLEYKSSTATSAPVPNSNTNAVSDLPAGVKRVDVNVLQQEYFECQKCKKEFSNAGTCPFDGGTLIRKTRSYTYKCKLCGYMNEKAGNCPACKGHPVLKKFEVSYRDADCKQVSSEPGKCPKCGQDLKRVINVEMKK